MSPAAVARSAEALNSVFPSVQTSSTSIPAGILISALCTQVSHGSLQPSTRKLHDPSRSRVTEAVHQSKPAGVVRCMPNTACCPSGFVSTTDALTASWPSRKTWARIGMDSPTAALAG